MVTFLALLAVAAISAFLGLLWGLGTGYRRGRLDERRALLAELERIRRAA